MPPCRVGDDPAGPCILARRAAMEVLVRGSHLLDRDDVSVARTTIPQAGGLGLRSFAPTEGESATPVCRPGAVIVTHDGLGFAVAECDEVGSHSGIPFDCGGVSIGTRSHAAAVMGFSDDPLLGAPKR